ncbi:MAG: redoxin family protein [Patescibacteria group bacterium]
MVISCTAGVSINSLSPGASETLRFDINNEDTSDNILWIKIDKPSSKYTITGASAPEGAVSYDSDSVTLTGIEIYGPSGTYIEVSVTTSSSEESAKSWEVNVADNTDGTSPTSCSGSLSTSISEGDNPEAPLISSLSVSDITNSSVKIKWTTNEEANSVVEYGLTTSYGKSKSSSKRTKTHSITLKDLKTNKTYHYRVKSTDSGGNEARTSDNTFVTAKKSIVTTTIVTEVKEASPTIEYIFDKTQPLIVLTSDLSKPFTTLPKLLGNVSDNTKIGKVEYSMDNGFNWLPVPLPEKSESSAKFEFSPSFLEDGDFDLRLRATDTSGNIRLSDSYKLIIDVIPPQAGMVLLNSGPQIFEQDQNGFIFLPMGEININLSSIGGPVSIDVVSTKSVEETKQLSEKGIKISSYSVFANKAIDEVRNTASLTRDLETGLWRGVLFFEGMGVYHLEAFLIDGAGNKTQRKLGRAVILPGGVVTNNGKPLEDALVTVYMYEELSNTFIPWDAQAFSQENPQRTLSDGSYKLLLPEGKYYLSVRKPGFKETKTKSFLLLKPFIVSANFSLAKSWNFLGVSNIWADTVDLEVSYPSIFVDSSQKDLKLVTLPNFNLRSEGEFVNNLALRGKPTIVSFMTSWAPSTPDQLSNLNNLEQEVNSVVIMPHESDSKVAIFKKRGGYKPLFLADPKGSLIESLGLLYSPTHLIMDRKGNIKELKTGVLTANEIFENLYKN